MFQDVFNSIKGNFKQKTTNPFFGTLLLVWIFKNWIIIYGIFNFDESYNLENKINFIKGHLNNDEIFSNLLELIGLSFIILIISYTLLNVARFIINVFEKKVTPWVYKKTDINDVVLKSIYDKSEAENYILREKLESERTNRIKAVNERNDLENSIKAKNDPVSFSTEPSKEILELEKFEIIANNLNKIEMLGIFGKIIEDIGNEKIYSPNDNLNYLVTIGLVKKVGAFSGGGFRYSFTPEGEKFKNYYVDRFILNKGNEILPIVIN